MWSFIGVSLLVIMVPVADMALVARNTVAHGRRTGLMTAAGTLTGLTP